MVLIFLLFIVNIIIVDNIVDIVIVDRSESFWFTNHFIVEIFLFHLFIVDIIIVDVIVDIMILDQNQSFFFTILKLKFFASPFRS